MRLVSLLGLIALPFFGIATDSSTAEVKADPPVLNSRAFMANRLAQYPREVKADPPVLNS